MRKLTGMHGGTVPRGKPALRIPGSNLYAIPLTGKRGRGRYALIDAVCAVPEITKWSWSLKTTGYPEARINGVSFLLHEMVMKVAGITPPSDGLVVDHENGRKTTNTIENIRWTTQAINAHRTHSMKRGNTYKGVWCNNGRWIAGVKVNRRNVSCGSHDTPELAAAAYDAKARELFGEFALTNEDLGLLQTLPEGACR